jgi:hypothetical protein
MPRSPEHLLQCAILDYWRLCGRRDLMCFAVGNGGYRPIATAVKLKAEGVMPGVTDLVVVLENHGCGWMEVKTPKGRLSDEQIGFGRRVQALGHYWAVVRSVDEAAKVFAAWGALRADQGRAA